MEHLYMTNCVRGIRRRKRKKKLLRACLRIAIAVLAGSTATMVLVPLAYQERGDWAIGGEWAGALFVAFIAFQISGWILEKGDR